MSKESVNLQAMVPDEERAGSSLLPTVYSELRRMAAARMVGESLSGEALGKRLAIPDRD